MNFEEYIIELHQDALGDKHTDLSFEDFKDCLTTHAWIKYANEYAIIQADRARSHGRKEVKQDVNTLLKAY